MNNGRNNGLAAELFTADHRLNDPQVPTPDGPDGIVAAVSTYQTALNGHWEIDEIFSCGDKVVARWTGSGEHVADLNGIPPTGKRVEVSAIAIHQLRDGKIAETWEVWDTLGLLQQLGVVPAG